MSVLWQESYDDIIRRQLNTYNLNVNSILNPAKKKFIDKINKLKGITYVFINDVYINIVANGKFYCLYHDTEKFYAINNVIKVIACKHNCCCYILTTHGLYFENLNPQIDLVKIDLVKINLDNIIDIQGKYDILSIITKNGDLYFCVKNILLKNTSLKNVTQVASKNGNIIALANNKLYQFTYNYPMINYDFKEPTIIDFDNITNISEFDEQIFLRSNEKIYLLFGNKTFELNYTQNCSLIEGCGVIRKDGNLHQVYIGKSHVMSREIMELIKNPLSFLLPIENNPKCIIVHKEIAYFF